MFSDIVKNDQELTISELPYTDTPVNEGNLPCQVCNGLGKTSDLENPKECEWCKGTGVYPQPSTDGPYPTTGRPDPNANYNPGNKSVEGDVEKKDYSDKERADLADKGQALPDGSYPIKNVAGLKKAIQAFGRAKDPAKVKAHIKARAKALGRADLIPDEWEKAVDAEILKWAESLNKGAESGQWLHDPKDLAAIRSGLVELLKAELDEVASGDDEEYCDLDQLLCALNLFLAWWKGEAEEGETTAPFPSNESDDVMAFTGLGVSADLIKSATADDASDDAKEELRSEIVKSLGLESVFDLKAKLSDAEETIKGLTGRLDTVEQMAAPGGPAKTGTPKGSTNTNPQIVAKMTQVDKFLRLAETVTDPIEARGFRADAQRLLNEVQAASN